MQLWLPALLATLTLSRALGARVAHGDEVISTTTRSFESNSTYTSVTTAYKTRSVVSGYVSAPGNGHLYLNGQLFDFRIFNTPTLLQTFSEFEVEDLLQTITAFGTPVTRTYTLQVANDMFKGGSMTSAKAHVLGWDENSDDWTYNETVWRQMDNAYGVRLIIPIINQDYGSSDSDYVGNFNDLIRHRYNISDYGVANRAVDWFTDRTMIDSFKKLISFLMNRVNTVNGIRYGDDETVLAFETGNELNWGDAQRVTFTRPPPAAWTLEIAEHIKSLAPNLLVMDGSFSRTGKNGSYWETAVLDSKNVDLFSYHLYGDGDVDLYDGLNNEVRAHGKTLIIGEHGFYGNITTYLKAYQKFDCAGALIWSLRGHSEKGGFVTHGEGNNIYSYHSPGWRNQTSKNFDIQEADVISATYNASFAVLGREPPPKPIPGAPHIFFITNGTHAGLSLQGAAWAEHYEIYGGHFEGISFKLLTNEVQDNVGPGELFIPLDPRQPTKTLLLPPRVYKPIESQAGWEDNKWCVPGSICYDDDGIIQPNSTSDQPKNLESKSTSTSSSSSEKVTSSEKVISSEKGTSTEKVTSTEKHSSSSSTEKVKYRVLPLMYPSRRKRAVIQGGWYSVRGVSADGTPGIGSRALFLKSEWQNWSFAE